MKLYRHLNSDEAIVAHLAGRLWLRDFRYFREIEDSIRRDEHEGKASGPIDGGGYVHAATDNYRLSITVAFSF
jgi:hypothetical protein